MRGLLLVAVVGLALVGCQRSTPAPAPGPDVGPLTLRLKAEGDALMAQQEYEKAIVKYQTALNEAPNDIPIRYALAVALSYTPRRPETVEQFRTVMTRGAPGSVEVKAAREWLANANELEPGESQRPGDAPAAAAADAPLTTGNVAKSDAAKKGRVLGKIRWQDLEPRSVMVHVNISLIGEDGEARDIRLGRDFTIGRVYEFRELPPGSYRLVAATRGTTMWDMKVTVVGEKDTVMDLTDSNAVVPSTFKPESNS